MHARSTLILSTAGALALALTACGASDLEQCEQHGGDWRTYVRDPGGDGECVLPARDEGATCSDNSECSVGICVCPGNPFAEGPGRVANGTAATGTCPRFPVRGGDGGMCAIVHGVVHRDWIIVD